MISRRAPAKLNLGLRLLARRADGYHEIETVFVPLRLYDDVVLRATSTPGLRLTVSGAADVPSGPENLAWRAAERARAALGLTDEGGLEIELTKRIPAAAGLGGGSSDAAAVLLGVEALARRRLPAAERATIALALGADVPFFLDPRPALGRGVGERLEPLPDVPEMWWVLVFFPFPVSTARAYAEASRELTLPRDLSSIAALLGPSGLLSAPPNDLETATARRHPEITQARRALEAVGASVTGMSGSGPTVFGRFEGRSAAERGASAASLPEGVRTIAVSSSGSAPEGQDGA